MKNNIYKIINKKLATKIKEEEEIVNFLIQGKIYKENTNLKNFLYFMFYNNKKYLTENIISTPFFLSDMDKNKLKFDALLPLEQMPKNFNNKENTFIKKDYFQINISLNYENIDGFLLFVESVKCLLEKNENFLLTVNTKEHIYPDVYFITNNRIYTNIEEIEQRYSNEYNFYINKQKKIFIHN